MKKTNTENTGWQKLEQTQPAAAETSNEPLPEAEKENQRETQPTAEENENKQQEKAVPEVSPEQKKQSSRDTMSKKARRRKYSAAMPIGGVFVLLAVIGLITVIVFGVRATENLIDNSKQKEEFERIILPVLMFDPVPFEDPNEMGNLPLLRASIWSAILDNSEKYLVGDGNMVSVPQSDVDVACAKLFGSSVTLQHQGFEDYLSMYSYDESTKTYYVPVDVTALYTPQVEEITRNGDTFELLVGYVAPTNQWIQSLSGDTTEPSPSKYMIYELERVDDNYQLVGIKDPPGRPITPRGRKPARRNSRLPPPENLLIQQGLFYLDANCEKMQEEIVNFFLIFSQNAIFSWRYAFSWSMGRRTCSMVSRSRTVTQWSAAFSPSPTVSKSTVTQ